MKILSLDVSTNTGWALLEGELGARPTLLLTGVISKSRKTLRDYGDYPFSYTAMAEEMAGKMLALAQEHGPDVIVVEETNKGRSVYTQKVLEWIHCCLLLSLRGLFPVIYVRSSAWRRAVGLEMGKEDKKANAKLSKAKTAAAKLGATLDKKALGVNGKVTKKHLAVRKANELYSLDLKMKDNDIADAILLAVGYCMEAPHCDGIKER